MVKDILTDILQVSEWVMNLKGKEAKDRTDSYINSECQIWHASLMCCVLAGL